MTLAFAVLCKAPRAGAAKTRLAAEIGDGRAALLAAAFIQDVAESAAAAAAASSATPYLFFTPAGAEAMIRPLLPPSFHMLPQAEGDLGFRMQNAIAALLARGHEAVILIGADFPTLPRQILLQAARSMMRPGDRSVIGPAEDGGYYLIGLKAPHASLFEDIPWSTPLVLKITLERARRIGLAPTMLPLWYDVDNGAALDRLRAELNGEAPVPAGLEAAPAAATRSVIALCWPEILPAQQPLT